MFMQNLLRPTRERAVIKTGEKLRRLEAADAQLGPMADDQLDVQIYKLRRRKEKLLKKLQEGDSHVRA